MSFILDALKKSEAERQRQAGPALLEMRIVRPSRRLPPWAVVVGALLIGCVLVLGWVAWHAGSAPAAAPAPAAPPAAAPAPLAAATSAVAATPAGSAASTPASPATRTAPPEGAFPPHERLPAVDDGSTDGDAARNPADQEPAITPLPGSAAGGSGTTALHSYAELSGKLPELRLDLHVYAANPGDRYAFINMHKVREGDVTAEGLQVREITRDGVVLDYRGTEFLLGRQ